MVRYSGEKNEPNHYNFHDWENEWNKSFRRYRLWEGSFKDGERGGEMSPEPGLERAGQEETSDEGPGWPAGRPGLKRKQRWALERESRRVLKLKPHFLHTFLLKANSTRQKEKEKDWVQSQRNRIAVSDSSTTQSDFSFRNESSIRL